VSANDAAAMAQRSGLVTQQLVGTARRMVRGVREQGERSATFVRRSCARSVHLAALVRPPPPGAGSEQAPPPGAGSEQASDKLAATGPASAHDARAVALNEQQGKSHDLEKSRIGGSLLGGEEVDHVRLWLPPTSLMVEDTLLGFRVRGTKDDGTLRASFVPVVRAGEPWLLRAHWLAAAEADTAAFNRRLSSDLVGRIVVHVAPEHWPSTVPSTTFMVESACPAAAAAASPAAAAVAKNGVEAPSATGYHEAVQQAYSSRLGQVGPLIAAGRSRLRWVDLLMSRDRGRVRSADRSAGTHWALLSRGCDAPLAFAWCVHVLVSAATWYVLLQFVLVTAEAERALQARRISDYYGALAGSFFTAISSSLLLQEPVKVLLITAVSPQMLPQMTALRRTPLREAVRLCVRGLFGLLYFLLRAI